MLEQVVQEAAKNGGITVAIPTGVISSIVTVAIIKGSDLILGRMRGKSKNGTCPKPGEAKLCGDHSEAIEEHGKAIAGQVEAQKHNEASLKRIEDKVDELPFELIKIIQERK